MFSLTVHGPEPITPSFANSGPSLSNRIPRRGCHLPINKRVGTSCTRHAPYHVPHHYDFMSEFEDDDAQGEEEEEETYSQSNPANLHTPGYRPLRQNRTHPADSPGPEPMELETGKPDDFSKEVLCKEDPPLRVQPTRKCELRTKPSDQGYRTHRGRRQLLLLQASTDYKAAHGEQQEAGINVFIPTASPHFEANDEVPLDPKVFHYACHRL